MTAEEARKLNVEYALSLHLGNAEIDKKIKEAAIKGKTTVYLDLQGIEYAIRDRVFAEVKSVYGVAPKNFVVTREKYSGDMREAGSDGILISW